MKTIYLFRHAEPLRLADIHQEEWPLSPKGHDMAEALKTLNGAARMYASPLLRAVQTAQHTGLPLTVDPRLQERKTGNATPDMGDCWLRQYEDGTFKCPDGESFDEVGQRMQACLEEILAALGDGQAAIVVSHAAAICAYLKRFCTIRVTDRPSKTRAILWQERTVYAGNLPPMAGFALRFRQGTLVGIEALSS